MCSSRRHSSCIAPWKSVKVFVCSAMKVSTSLNTDWKMRLKSCWKWLVRIKSMAGIWWFRYLVKNSCLKYYSRNLVLFNFRGDNARVFQRVSMNLNMTVGQAACQLLCQYTQSTLTASCVCWIVSIVTCDSIKINCSCSCLKCTWSVA